MTRALWSLRSNQARIEGNQLDAKLDLSRPYSGLFDIHADKVPLRDTTLTALRFPTCDEDQAIQPTQSRARHGDLSVSYPASTDWPVNVDVLWRIASPTAVELVLSVWTDQLVSHPRLAVRSRLATDEVLRVTDAGSGVCQATDIRPGETLELKPDGGPGCLLLRLAGAELSYVEMVHPADFLDDQIVRGTQDDGLFEIRHHLFPEPLEKGVLRQARLRGVFLPREGDMETAAVLYSKFAASEPSVAG